MDGLQAITGSHAAAGPGAPATATASATVMAMATAAPDPRRMVRGELFSRATHTTTNGVDVHVWRRGEQYLGRGRYQGRQFGQTLGKDPAQADAALRRLLGDLESGAFVMPSDARKRPLRTGVAPRLSLRELYAEFLQDVRRVRGAKTCQDYRCRLAPALAFAEAPANRKRWPLDRSRGIGRRRSLYNKGVVRGLRTGWERGAGTKTNGRRVGTRVPASPLTEPARES